MDRKDVRTVARNIAEYASEKHNDSSLFLSVMDHVFWHNPDCSRISKAIELVRKNRVYRHPCENRMYENSFFVESLTKNVTYVVIWNQEKGSGKCTCQDFKNTGKICKHMLAAMLFDPDNPFFFYPGIWSFEDSNTIHYYGSDECPEFEMQFQNSAQFKQAKSLVLSNMNVVETSLDCRSFRMAVK